MGAQLHPISTHPSGEVAATRELDVVFVHGLGGDPFGTWRYGEDESTSWPHWLAEEYGERIGVWSFGYPTSKSTAPRLKEGLKKLQGLPFDEDAGYSMPLPDRARNALNVMVRRGIGQRPCIFIVHSLGGLLVKYMLNLAHDEDEDRKEHALIANCKALLFLATPHQGSKLASLVKEFKCYFPSVTIDELQDNDSHLRKLYQWYRKWAREYKIDTRSFSESRATGGVVVVVEPDSADPGIGRDPIPLDADHLAISRPKRKDDAVVEEARELIEAQLPGLLESPLNPEALKAELSDSPIPDPFPDTDFHLKVSVEEKNSSQLGLVGRGSEGGSLLACRVDFSLYQGKIWDQDFSTKHNHFLRYELKFNTENPEPLIEHLKSLISVTRNYFRSIFDGKRFTPRLHFHLMLPLSWLSGSLPEHIQKTLKRPVFFGCSNREVVAESAVAQLLLQAMQVSERLHSNREMTTLQWATACHEEVPPIAFDQLFDPTAPVIHLTACDLDGEEDHSHLVERDALLATEPRLLFTKRFNSTGREGEERIYGRWEHLVKVGLPLVLWWRPDSTDELSASLAPLGLVLKGSWSQLCSHLELLVQMVKTGDEEKRAMQALMKNLGIFYEEPIRYLPAEPYVSLAPTSS
jgi:hypothetical protein